MRPVAVRMVWQVYEAVGLPVIGMGGITGGRDAVEFILAGATAVAVGTGNFVDPACSLRVVGDKGLHDPEWVSNGLGDGRVGPWPAAGVDLSAPAGNRMFAALYVNWRP